MIVLASSSPRRIELLGRITDGFLTDAAQIDERALPILKPAAYVAELAAAKGADVAARHPEATVIAADTMVADGDKLLGKPKDAADATRMIRELSGKTHQTFTGMWVREPDGSIKTETVRTDVTFWDLSDAEIADFVRGESWRDKAGAYGIQDDGALLVRSINGDYYNVVGLPISTLARMLR
jgi:septum formation protein